MNSKLQKELIDKLAEICEELGWSIGVPADDDTAPVDGLIVGTEEFIMGIVESINGESLEVFSKESSESEFSEPVLLDKKKLMH